MKKIKKSVVFWIMIVSIAVPIFLIYVGIGNQQIVYGLLTGLVIGFIITILSWVTK